MKCVVLCIALVSVLFLSQASGKGQTRALDEYWEGISSRLPLEEIQSWVIEKYTSDKDFQALIDYLRSDHFLVIDQHIQKNQWQYDFLMYIESNNIEIILYLNVIRSFLGLPEIQPPSKAAQINLKAKPEVDWELMHLALELHEIIEPSWPELSAYIESIKDEPDVVEFINIVKSDENKEYVLEYLGGHQEFKELIEILKEGNLPMDEMIEAMKEALGWN